MKIIELINNVSVPITNEEAEILDLFVEHQLLEKSDLDPRQVVLANQLVNKDILYRRHEEGRILYKKKI